MGLLAPGRVLELDIVQRRATVTQLLAALEILPNPNVTSEDLTVPGPEGAPDIKVRIYRPAEATGTLPGIYFIHGGGMILGDIDGEDAVATEICERVDAVVVSVEYRLAPEHPYSRSPRGSCRPASRLSCTSIPVPTTRRKCSRRKLRYRSGSGRAASRLCAAASPDSSRARTSA